MKSVLKNELMKLGYALSYSEEKLKDLDAFLVEKKAWEINDDDIAIERYEEPTDQIPIFFLNVEDLFEKILVFDGDIHTIYKENSLEVKLQLADYLVCNRLCLIRNNKKQKSENFIL